MMRRFRRSNLRRVDRRVVLCLAVLSALLLLRWGLRPPKLLSPGTYAVQRVVDGDTLLLSNRRRVRLIGVDTPETVKPDHPVEPWGPEAAAFAKDFVSGGRVRLEFDGPRKDRFGRWLAYVWVGDRMLNEELVRAGLARAQTQYEYSAAVKARFLQAQTDAQRARRGLWSQLATRGAAW